MVFELGSAASDLTSSIKNSKLWRGIFGNPIYTSVGITVVLVIIVFVLLYDYIPSDDTVSVIVKISLWGFLGTVIFVFLHHQMTTTKADKKVVNGAEQIVFDNSQHLLGGENFIPVQPTMVSSINELGGYNGQMPMMTQPQPPQQPYNGGVAQYQPIPQYQPINGGLQTGGLQPGTLNVI